jgi:hypothetical protein
MSLKSDWRSLDYTQELKSNCEDLIEAIKDTWANGGYIGMSEEQKDVALGRVQGIQAVLDWIEEAPEEEEDA